MPDAPSTGRSAMLESTPADTVGRRPEILLERLADSDPIGSLLTSFRRTSQTSASFGRLFEGFGRIAERGAALKRLMKYEASLTETLRLYGSRVSGADGLDRDVEVKRALSHLAINTDAPLDRLDEAIDLRGLASSYAKSLGYGAVQIDGRHVTAYDGGTPTRVAKLSRRARRDPRLALREIGRALNQRRLGTETLLPVQTVPVAATPEKYDACDAYVSAAFSNLAYLEPKQAVAAAQAMGFDRAEWVEDAGTDTQVLVAANADVTVVAYRGSASFADFRRDARPAKKPAFGGGVHNGFLEANVAIRDRIDEAVERMGADKRLVFTGHSLGAALAQLNARHAAAKGRDVAAVHGFGSPRVGDAAFCRAYDEVLGDRTFLHVNDSDPVAKMPPEFMGFLHVGRTLRFDDDGVLSHEPRTRSAMGLGLESAIRAVDPAEQERQAMADFEAAIAAIEAQQRAVAAPPVPDPDAAMLERAFLPDFLNPFADHSLGHYVALTGSEALAAMLPRA